eukprot:1467619-Prymnesium_polylepis.1
MVGARASPMLRRSSVLVLLACGAAAFRPPVAGWPVGAARGGGGRGAVMQVRSPPSSDAAG